MAIEEGYAFVGPNSREVAVALLAAAEQVGEGPFVVRSTVGGFYVPENVSRAYEAGLGAPEADPEVVEVVSDPDDSWKVADIKEWAAAHEVDLGDATKKADLLAAIQAHKEE